MSQTTIHLVSQKKGGAGKTTLTTLNALKYDSLGLLKTTTIVDEGSKKKKEKSPVSFIDSDHETQSLSKTQQFLKGNTPPTLFVADLLNEKKTMVRDSLLLELEKWAALPYDKIYVDFGAGESAQFANIIELDFPIEQIKEYTDSIKTKLVFDIVVGGGSNFKIHTDYLKQMVELNKGVFELNIWINKYSFYQQQTLIDSLHEFFNFANELVPGSVNSINEFGAFDNQSKITDNIIEGLGNGLPFSEYGFWEQNKLKSQFANLK